MQVMSAMANPLTFVTTDAPSIVSLHQEHRPLAESMMDVPTTTASHCHGLQLTTALMDHQMAAVEWMEQCEQKQGGGILADDMGLGKTMDSIAVMVRDVAGGGLSASASHPQYQAHSTSGLPSPAPWAHMTAPNLVLCPKSLLGQWKDELLAHTNLRFDQILIYHGKRRQKKRRHAQQQWTAQQQQQHMVNMQQHGNAENDDAGQGESLPEASVGNTMLTSTVPFFVVLMTYDTVRAEYQQYLQHRRKRSTIIGNVVSTTTAAASPSSLSIIGSKQSLTGSDNVAHQKHFVFDTMWHRIILDEAHMIRVQHTQVTHAVMALRSHRRWCVTGTPYNNSVRDVASLCAFLRIAPYNSSIWWNEHGEDEEAITRWREQCLLRRTKSILSLPPVEHVVMDCPLDEDERRFYEYIYTQAVQKYAQFQHCNQNSKLQMFGTMLSYLLRLRQACDHPLIVLGRGHTRAMSVLSLSSVASIEANQQEQQTCIACGQTNATLGQTMAPTARWVDLECGHRMCVYCHRAEMKKIREHDTRSTVGAADAETVPLVNPVVDEGQQIDRSAGAVVTGDKNDTVGNSHQGVGAANSASVVTRLKGMAAPSGVCPLCIRAARWKEAVYQSTLADATLWSRTSTNNEDGDTQRTSHVQQQGQQQQEQQLVPTILDAPSTKILTMLDCVRDARQRNPHSKVVIFSQWTTAMDVIENALVSSGYGVVRYDGDVSNVDKRHDYVRAFRSQPDLHVFLCSLQAGGLGLNLAVADTVIIFDSWYNPFAEDQAVDRVHRLGQTRPVRVIRLRAPNTVEDDVYRIQQRKRLAASALFKLNRHDQVGASMTWSDCKTLTEEDVHSIFKTQSSAAVCKLTIHHDRKDETTMLQDAVMTVGFHVGQTSAAFAAEPYVRPVTLAYPPPSSSIRSGAHVPPVDGSAPTTSGKNSKKKNHSVPHSAKSPHKSVVPKMAALPLFVSSSSTVISTSATGLVQQKRQDSMVIVDNDDLDDDDENVDSNKRTSRVGHDWQMVDRRDNNQKKKKGGAHHRPDSGKSQSNTTTSKRKGAATATDVSHSGHSGRTKKKPSKKRKRHDDDNNNKPVPDQAGTM